MPARTQPKLQHYLPRSYLRYFADSRDMISCRRRGAAMFTTNIANAAAETHLYSVSLPDGTKDVTAEETLSKFEGIAHTALDELRTARIPRAGSDGRHAISAFLALRGPAHLRVQVGSCSRSTSSSTSAGSRTSLSRRCATTCVTTISASIPRSRRSRPPMTSCAPIRRPALYRRKLTSSTRCST